MTQNPIQVLLVEDNPGDARLIREQLADAGAAGFMIETVQTLADAVERCSRPGVDAVLLDLGLPDSFGLDTLKTLRARVPELPVVVLTGLDDEKTAVQAVQAGAQDYLIKGEIGGALMPRALRYAVERKRADAYREMGLEILQILNEPGNRPEAIQRVLAALKTRIGFDAVGLRLQNGEDFPYFAQQGFSKDFLLTENSLIGRDANGGVCRDKDGHVSLECTCGLVLSGRTDPAHPLFTRGGSFWTNDSFPLLDLPPGQDPRFHPRNQCIHQGYASVALIPIRTQDGSVGLLQFNDRRKGCFTLETVELLEGIASHIGAALMRKRAEEALRENEEKLALALRSARMGVWQWDVVANKRRFDDQVCYLLGLNPATFTGAAAEFFAAVHPDDREKISAALARVIAQDEPYAPEYRVVWPDGSIHHISARGRLVRDETGRPLFLNGVVWDISERKRAEEELRKMQKLQSVGTLAGGIAHDFNNILMGVFGNLSLAKDELAKDHPGYTSLEEAEKSMSRAVRLTKQLLTFAKGGDPVKEDISLGALAGEVARFDLSGSKVKLVYRPADDLWLAEVDKGQIQQVISNLTINARQAMPDGGHLYITLENADLPEAAIPGLRQGKYVKVTVRDEGTGIDPKHLDRIFDPYFTTKQTGNGLGLATTYSIISKHGGHIGVVSELGKGTTFTFHLPASEAPPSAEAKPPAAPGPALDHPVRILVMDDEETVCQIAVKMLNRCGFFVATAPDGQEAIAMYQQAMKDGAPFDAVIMDLTVPGGDGGKEAIKKLLAIDPQANAIVSSGYADDPVMANYADYGFKGIAVKPYTKTELRDALARVLNR